MISFVLLEQNIATMLLILKMKMFYITTITSHAKGEYNVDWISPKPHLQTNL